MEIGDRVIIKPATEIKNTRTIAFVPKLKRYCGKETTIREKSLLNNIFYLWNCEGAWHESWLELAPTIKIKNISEDDITSMLE